MYQLATEIVSIVGSNSEIIYEKLPADDPFTREPDISIAKQILDWNPKVSLEDGLKLTVEYFKKEFGI